MATELVVALDFNDQKKADEMIEKLADLPIIFKVGLELFLSAERGWVETLCANKRVFLDLKFYDIPNTTAGAVVRAAKLGAEFVTVHLSGGRRMLDEINVRLTEALLSGEIKRKPKVLGVSILTSFNQEEWVANVSHVAKLTGVRTIAEAVVHFAELAGNHPGVQGMVCSPQEIVSIKQINPDLFLMVPGIRPAGSDTQDQSRIMTAADAKNAGASAIVVGRPIIQSPDPRAMAEYILKEIS